ncbi:MAG: RNA polymerase sigma factor [Xanthomonadales bacterium]|jgi:RNA polymerase sigma-70 factor (ECF subfamily)|nr:RNA polymerase sigma factor [Xanthomonadales bacterium]
MRQELVQLGNGAHALAIQILGNSDDAADAVHDAYIAVLDKPGSYDSGKGPLKPWFLRVVRNRCIDLLRKRRTDGVGIDLLLAPGAMPDESLEAVERDLALHGALAMIKPEQRQIVVLRDYLDLSYAEIAAVLEIAPGTVMSRLHRARLALKDELEEQHE